jgi:hypothetical protein
LKPGNSVPRKVYLARSITAEAGGWAGDAGLPWSQDNPPVAAVGETTTTPIFNIPMRLRWDNTTAPRGVAGLVRVYGPDATRQFTLNMYLEWARVTSLGPPMVEVSDWRMLVGSTGLVVGDGSDISTDPAYIDSARIAVSLVPIGGDLGAGSTCELWLAEI